MSNIVVLESKTFVEYLKTKMDSDLTKYLFKIETVGEYFTTQDCKPFLQCEYKQIAFLHEFVNWLEMQPYIFKSQGYCQEITEIWYRQDIKKLKDRTTKQPQYILIWTKEKGWLGKQHFTNLK